MSQVMQTPGGDPDSPWEDLVVSILSVNQYSVEKTYAVLPLLRQAGLLCPHNLGSLQLEEIISRLEGAGCNRGPFMTKLFAIRLASLGLALELQGVEKCQNILLSAEPSLIRALLLPINGIGPKVVNNFFMLRDINDDPS